MLRMAWRGAWCSWVRRVCRSSQLRNSSKRSSQHYRVVKLASMTRRAPPARQGRPRNRAPGRCRSPSSSRNFAVFSAPPSAHCFMTKPSRCPCARAQRRPPRACLPGPRFRPAPRSFGPRGALPAPALHGSHCPGTRVCEVRHVLRLKSITLLPLETPSYPDVAQIVRHQLQPYEVEGEAPVCRSSTSSHRCPCAPASSG